MINNDFLNATRLWLNGGIVGIQWGYNDVGDILEIGIGVGV